MMDMKQLVETKSYVYSHQSFIHLLANSLALVSFGKYLISVSSIIVADNGIEGHAASVYLMQEQAKSGSLESSPRYHFWGAFVAGVLSTLLYQADS